MNSPQVEQLLAKEFASLVLPELPFQLVAASVEVNSWVITVHCYQTSQIDDQTYDFIQAKSCCLLDTLPSRQGEPWQLAITLHRVQPGVQPIPLGCPVESTTWAT